MKKCVKKVLSICVCMAFAISLVACGSSSSSKTYTIGIVQIVKHPSLDTIRTNIIKALSSKGYKKGDNLKIEYKNANGDTANLTTICQGFKDDGVDAIVAIATPSAQAAAPFAEDIPVIFAAVSDPVGAGLVKSLKNTSGNITGTSDALQIDQNVDLALEMYPETKSIGYLYNSGEANSVSYLKTLKKYAAEKGLTVNESAVTNAADISTATKNLIDNSDLIITGTDNTVASSMDVVKQLTRDSKTPFIAGADSMVSDGALATIGIDYSDLGKETGKMTAKVLNGTKVSDIPVKVFKTNLSVYINTDTAKAIGFDKLDSIKANHKNVVELTD